MNIGVLDRGKFRSILCKHRYNLALFLLMMIDFLYTYIGINYLGVITEGNPGMVWLFEIDFIYSLGVRLLLVTIIVGLVCYIKEIEHKWYKILIGIGLTANIGVTFMHLYWVSETIKYMGI